MTAEGIYWLLAAVFLLLLFGLIYFIAMQTGNVSEGARGQHQVSFAFQRRNLCLPPINTGDCCVARQALLCTGSPVVTRGLLRKKIDRFSSVVNEEGIRFDFSHSKASRS